MDLDESKAQLAVDAAKKVARSAIEDLTLSPEEKQKKDEQSSLDRKKLLIKVVLGLTAIAVDDRFLFNALAYYGRNFLNRPGAPPLKIWLRRNQAGNQAEAQSPLTPALGGRVLVVTAAEVKISEDGGRRMQPRIALLSGDFAASQTLEVSRARLDSRRLRRTVLILGEGYQPRRKD